QEIYKDRQKFSEQVFNVASSDLVNMGISVVSYTLKDIHDDQVAPGGDTEGGHKGTGVWEWGRRDGDRGWGHRSGMGLSSGPPAFGGAGRDRGCDSVPVSPGLPALAGEGPHGAGVPRPQVARTKQQIEEQRAQVLVVERAQQAQLQEHEIGRRERELEATVRKPAEAERYRLERLAEAQR
ncbi:FLOT1 protein, partial [Pluvianellus socialis]|nr:FLOT1 protein [Pluvianellus socialis]